MQRSALCRSRRELSNEYLLAKIDVDTAENEPLEVWGKIQFTIHFTPYLLQEELLAARLASSESAAIAEVGSKIRESFDWLRDSTGRWAERCFRCHGEGGGENSASQVPAARVACASVCNAKGVLVLCASTANV